MKQFLLLKGRHAHNNHEETQSFRAIAPCWESSWLSQQWPGNTTNRCVCIKPHPITNIVINDGSRSIGPVWMLMYTAGVHRCVEGGHRMQWEGPPQESSRREELLAHEKNQNRKNVSYIYYHVYILPVLKNKFFYVYECLACTCACIPCGCSTHRSCKRVESEFSGLWETEPKSSGRVASALNHRTFSLLPCLLLL